jgi:hypothetical protein
MPAEISLFENKNKTNSTFKMEPDFQKIKLLDDLVSDCSSRGIMLILVQSPRYRIIEQVVTIKLLEDIITKYNVEFWNYVNDSVFMKHEYFRDFDHLVDTGARKFTNTIASRIKKRIVDNEGLTN